MMLMNVMAVGRERRDASDAIPERRRWPRSRAARVRARIAWRARGFPVQKFPIRLIDISQGGARIAIDSPEPPDLSSISDANVVVSFKNLLKKDATTKAKALDDLVAYVEAHPYEQDGGAEEAVLEAWVRFLRSTPFCRSD